jgi:hypothetical protein
MTQPSSQAATTFPADDPARNFTLAQSDDPNLPHIGLVGDTYTILVAGKDTAGPSNAPHQFQNKSGQPARLLCLCSPAGQEEFFKEVGVPVATRTTSSPPLDKEAEAAFVAKVKALATKYRTELLPPKRRQT